MDGGIRYAQAAILPITKASVAAIAPTSERNLMQKATTIIIPINSIAVPYVICLVSLALTKIAR